ncbi:restriction endonuclease subunit S [Streptomyces sp. NPDC058385]|uniref:restriction endonuclease subunit S n=1 Tax=Streptomyces sp. NPDC058385 TaxID=3346473 RepID=UPI0036624FD3
MTHVRIKSVVRNVVQKSDGASSPFLGLEDIEGGTGRLLVKELPRKAAEDSICHESGDVLFSKLRPYLAKSYLPNAKGTGTGELLVLRPSAEVNAKFLIYVTLSSPWVEWANTTAYGTKMPRTSWELVGDYRTWLPPLEEQRRIADFLDAETARIDALTSRRKVQQQLLVERRAALKTECVTYSGPQKVHHPLLGDIHPDWQVLPLRRILPAINVGVVINPSHYFTESGVPFIHGFNVREGFISQVGMKFMSGESNELHRRSRVYVGDVLVVRAGATAGRAAKVGEEFDGANCASVLILRKSETLDAAYLETFLNAVAGKGQVSFSQYGAAQEVISAGQVSSFSIALPPMSEQVERVAELSAATAETVALESGLTRQVALLSERRQALITAAVTGQFDVSTASGRHVTDGVSA